MDNNIKNARKALQAGREIEKNLPVYLRGVAGAYYKMAYFNLAMQYTTFAGSVSDHEVSLDEKESGYAERIAEMLRKYILENAIPAEYEEGLKELLAMREDFTERMQILTAYTDRLYLHEYALKRLAPEFENTKENVDSQTATNELVGFLFQESRRDSLRENIAFALSELPIRMTKAKFFDWIRETSAAFREADSESLNRTFYMLFSSAGLLTPDGMDKFEEFQTALRYFDGLDYKKMDEKGYQEAKLMLETVTEHISLTSDQYCSMMEVINQLTSIFLLKQFVSGEDESAVACCKKAVEIALREEPATDEECEEIFSALEGVVEELETDILAEEGVFVEFPVKDAMIEAMMQKVLYTRILYAMKLHTTSIFIRLEENTEETTYEEELNRFLTALNEAMEKEQKALSRARMAQVLYHLPIPFTTSKEVQSYILSAFDNCHDDAEKTAALREIRNSWLG